MMFVLGAFLTGIYPAFIQSSFKPVTMLKRVKLSNSKAGIIFKRGLLSSQFFSSIVLIVFTMVIFKQIKLMKDKDKGIEIENIVSIKVPRLQLRDSLSIANNENFKNDLLQYHEILKISSSSATPGNNPLFRAGVWKENDVPENSKMQALVTIDYDFLDLYNIKIISGRAFSEEFSSDINSVIINESALNILGFSSASDAINQSIKIYGEEGALKIIGVVKNYNQESLKKSIEPIVFLLTKKMNRYFSIKISNNNRQNTLEIIKKKWDQVFEGNPFNYVYVDDHFNSLYKEDYLFGKVIGTFSILTIIITCIGILGLSFHSIIQKTKEIGVRKVLGADIKNIIYVLIKEYIVLIVIMTIASWPISYFLINKWLLNYAYRTNIPLWANPVAGLIVLTITVLTIFYHAYRAAKKDPVIALKYE
jgi:putative ABC transport system permease protein